MQISTPQHIISYHIILAHSYKKKSITFKTHLNTTLHIQPLYKPYPTTPHSSPHPGIEPGEDEDGEDAVHDKINQDRGCVVYPYRSSDEEALFMVLDGHGEQGDRISEFVMRQVRKYFNFCFILSSILSFLISHIS